MEEIYLSYKNELPVNFTGKANYIYSQNLEPLEIRYYKDGKIHRDDGPALIENYRYLQDRRNKFFLNGNYFPDKEKWLKALNEEQLMRALFNIEEWR